MKIALLAPPWIALPPNGYGGIETIVYNLSEKLTEKGHNVIVYATGDSHISSGLQYYYKNSLGIDMLLEKDHALFFLNHIYYSLKNLPGDLDIVHNHCEYYAMHLLDSISTPFIHTLHGAFYKTLDKDRRQSGSSVQAYQKVLELFAHHPFVSISDFQRTGKPDLNYIKTVYNAINIDNFSFFEHSESDYISWLGRYSPLKGLDVAIQVAKLTKRKLQFSASIHTQRQGHFEKFILPFTDNKNVFSNGEIKDTKTKNNFIGKSKLFLFPIQWEEPFGLVMIEAMAAGTPVIALARGSVKEVIKDGETGFIVNPSDEDIRGNWIIRKNGVEGLCEAVERINTMPHEKYQKLRKNCRAHVEKNFAVERMVTEYEKAYEKVLSIKN